MEIKMMARGSGKSSMIAELMKRQRYKQSICIQPNMKMKKSFCYVYEISEKRVFTLSEYFRSRSVKGLDVFMDEVGACLQAEIPKIVLGTHTD